LSRDYRGSFSNNFDWRVFRLFLLSCGLLFLDLSLSLFLVAVNEECANSLLL